MGNQDNPNHKTREELVQELDRLRRRVAELEFSQTEHRQVELALRQSEKRFRTIADFTHDWEYWIDPDGRYVYVSPSCERVTGYSADAFLADPDLLEKIIHPQDLETFVQHMREEAQQLAELLTEFRIITRAGETRWIHHVCQPVYNDDGSDAGRRASNRDITERIQAEDALRQRNRQLALLNQASQALTSNLDLDQVLVSVLGEARRLLNVVAASIWLSDPETNELTCLQAVGPQSDLVRGWRLEPGEGIAGWVVQSGQTIIVPDTESDARHFKGVDRQIGQETRSIISVPLRVRQNVVGAIQILDTCVDRFSSADLRIVEPLAASAAIAIENAQLVQALRQRTTELEARNEELAAFAHSVAHDLKNPLARVVGYSETLAEQHPTMLAENLDFYLNRIAKTGRKMDNIIDALLLLSEIRDMEIDMRPLEMADIVEEVTHSLALEMEKRRATFRLPEEWPHALGYAPWIEQVWVNYISNAIKYGGNPPHIEMGAGEQEDGMIQFWVRDNGPGISSEAQNHLFTPFTRLNQVRVKGHGLGLSIVRRIVERLGGQVGVESEVGQGSLFTFTLPAAQSEIEKKEKKEAYEEEKDSRN